MSMFDFIKNGVMTVTEQYFERVLTNFINSGNLTLDAIKPFLKNDEMINKAKEEVLAFSPPVALASQTDVRQIAQKTKKSPTIVGENTCCASVKSKGGNRCTTKGKYTVVDSNGQPTGMHVCGRHVDKTTIDGTYASLKDTTIIHSSSVVTPQPPQQQSILSPPTSMSVPTILPGMKSPQSETSETSETLMPPTLPDPSKLQLPSFPSFPSGFPGFSQ